MKTIVDGLAVEYADEGHGEPLVMLHGWGDSLRTFDALTAELVATHRIVRLDMPGFGGTERPKGAWTVSDYAAFVGKFLEKFGINTYVIVGHSFGGRIAIKGAGRGILTPRAVVLMASAGNARRRTLRNGAYLVAAKIGKAISLLLPLRIRERMRARLYKSAESDYDAAGPMKDIFLNTIREDLSADATNIQQPALLIWGGQDEVTPLYDGKRLADRIPNSKIVVIPQAGHFLHREYPREVAGHIRSI